MIQQAFEASSQKDESFIRVWKRFQNSSPKTYKQLSIELCRRTHGPEFPEKAFADLDTLRNWYCTILHSWLNDSLIIADYWRERLPSQDQKLALLQVALEARATGIRRIQRRIFRESDGVPRKLPVATYPELSKWCDLMFELLADDEEHIGFERQVLTFRYDKGVAFRLEEERKQRMKTCDEWVAAATHAMMKAISKGKPHRVEPDDDSILAIWSDLANPTDRVCDRAVSLFIDAQPHPKQPHHQLFDDMISATWRIMRRLGPVCHEEQRVASRSQVREQLDAVQLYCRHRGSRLLANTSKATHPLDMIQKADKVPSAFVPDNQSQELILIGYMTTICGEANQIFRELPKEHGVDGEIEFKDDAGKASGRRIYVQLKNGVSHLRLRKTDNKEIFDVRKPRHLEYWVAQPVDVYLVIRDAQHMIRWMNITVYLNGREDKTNRQIIFDGEKLDREAILRVRSEALSLE